MATQPLLRLVKGEEATVSDDALCRAFLTGDGAAFGELVSRHQRLVYVLVRRYCARPEDAFDLTQRAFLQAFEAARRSLPRLGRRGPVPFRAWLVRISLNLGKNHLRQTRRWAEAPLEALVHEASPTPVPSETVERAQQERLTRATVLELPPRQREVFTLRIDGDLSFAEVAQTLGIEESAAKASFHCAVRRLRELFAASKEEKKR
ncbi:MAG: RNA polymerase sigma factor [Myxococcota bacterium]